jgi:O-acetyl-ADP-ribose deacetylase (regulator of RNase III)
VNRRKLMTFDNILDSECQALVNTTNVQGVMGAGLAAQFARRFPRMYEAYKLACINREHRMGEMLFYHDESGKTIVNFPTMEYPGRRADLKDIEAGLQDLSRAILMTQSPRLDSIAIPALGCGIGRLNWPDVESLISDYLGNIDWLHVEVYPPDGKKYVLKERVAGGLAKNLPSDHRSGHDEDVRPDQSRSSY